MKGIVFTEFMEMVEKEFGFEVLDKIISLENLHSSGVYTSVGNYPHGDILAMVVKLSKMLEVPVPDLVKAFGRYLFRTFSRHYQVFFKDISDSITFLRGIENVIHSEVRKLYADAVLPSFECEIDDSGVLTMDYQSKRPFADLAEGLILECLDYYDDDVEMERMAGPTGDAHSARFLIKPKG